MAYILKNAETTLGPYTSVETLDDRYHCDGVDIPFIVVGSCTVEQVADDWVNPSVIAAEKQRYNNGQKAKRAEAYPKESDPIFFKAQRGEATMQDWQSAVDAVKARFPYQE